LELHRKYFPSPGGRRDIGEGEINLVVHPHPHPPPSRDCVTIG
jgi:hypothetical protein